MPVTRRSAGGARARAGPARGQSTISFSNKVTKSVPRDAKKMAALPNTAKITGPQQAATATDEVDDVEGDYAEADDQAEVEAPQERVSEKSEAELRAERVDDAQIERYWNMLERQRRAPRVHQGDLDVGEKVLRYFDVSSQYGPCIGVSRMKRWQRAERLGLNPPIEILAVLLREEEKGTAGIETAQMEKILNSIAVGP